MKKKILFLILIVIIFALFAGVFKGFFYYQKAKLEIENFHQKVEEIIKIFKKEVPLENFKFGSFPILEKENFFEKVKKELIEKKLDFLLVNLSEKKLYFYKKGNLKKVYPVLTIGKEGSFWETPSGFYQVEAKIKNAYSSLGGVYMPYSLQFQGNFFIHGWPYWPDGTLVSSQFSGGCIRLSSKDAKEIFKEVKIGTPILVIEKEFFEDEFFYQLKPPQVSAKSYLAVDLKSNFVFIQKNSDKIYPIASIVKLITALVVCEYVDLWKKIIVCENDLIPTSKPRLKAGESYTSFDLLYPLLMESSNESAKVLAKTLGEKRFVELMNQKAKSIGMENTNLVDSWGGGKENVSSPKDLFMLAKYLFNNRRFILDITKGKIYHHLISKSFIKDLENFNCFYNLEEFVGGKIGKTKIAQETMLSIFNLNFRGETRPIAIIVLGSKDACLDTQNILNWIKERFE